MTDAKTLDAIFREALGLQGPIELADVAYGSTAEWDSVGHMQLMAAIEDSFGITLRSEDVIEMVAYGAVVATLRERYGLDV